MALLVPDVSEVILLETMLNKTAATDVKLKLYTNNRTPAEGDAIASYTESTGTGYVAITLTGASWTVATATGTTTAEYAQQTFTYTGAEANIYGYYVTNFSGAQILWAELFSDGPYSIPSGGGSVKITPKIELD
jgi:lipoprotein-anchoring transpeptidase ErfK/SrfK